MGQGVRLVVGVANKNKLVWDANYGGSVIVAVVASTLARLVEMILSADIDAG